MFIQGIFITNNANNNKNGNNKNFTDMITVNNRQKPILLRRNAVSYHRDKMKFCISVEKYLAIPLFNSAVEFT